LQELESRKSKRLRKALGDIKIHYEAVLIGCPLSLGNLTRSALTAVRHALIVAEPPALDLRRIGGVADLIDEVWDDGNVDLELVGVILNRVPAVSSEAVRRIAELARTVGHDVLWSPPVPQRIVFDQAVGERRPFTHAEAGPANQSQYSTPCAAKFAERPIMDANGSCKRSRST
jgi:chromosome partitioning protein